MTIEDEAELEAMRAIGAIVATVLHDMLDHARPGMTTGELDVFGAQRLAELGATSAPRATYDFPGATCISVNDGVAHGIPGNHVLTEGDHLNVDVSAGKDGFWADNGASCIVGDSGAHDAQKEKLLEYTLEARDRAIAAIKTGVSFNQVASIFSSVAKRGGFRLIENLCSHGIGRSLHEPPREISPVPVRRDRRRFTEGMVVAIEPFLTTGRGFVKQANDGWTLREEPGALSAQFEHTIVVWNDGAEILTVPHDA
jgi:methionyl aminopeptidase